MLDAPWRGSDARAGPWAQRTDSREERKRILLVADDPVVLDRLSVALNRDYDVVAAVDGIEALARLETEDFDAVVAELVLPLMDGPLLKRTMDALGRRVPFIILSSPATIRSVAGDLCGAEQLVKPFDAHQLASALARAIHASGRDGRPSPP